MTSQKSHSNLAAYFNNLETIKWVRLGDLAKIGTGSSNRQDGVENGEYPFYVRSKNILRTNSFEFDETAIVVPGEGGIGDIFHYVRGKYALHQRAYRISVVSELLNPKFLYHFMLQSFKQYIQMKSVGATSISIRKPMLEDFEIPIPCPENRDKSLQIQAEIVRILDAFTAHTAELTAELTARKKQYNYYRDKLLSFEDGEVEWKSLGSLATITIGEFVHKDKQDDSAQYPVYNGGRTATGYYENYNNTGNKIIVSARGANAGFVNRVSTPYWAGNSCYSIGIKDSSVLNWDFVYYFLKLSESKLIGSQQKGGIPAVSKKQMESFLVPVPELAHQERIVAVLDKFDALTNSITEGLPREIELRQKQYEYYRDLLLSFPKPDEQAA